VNQISILSQNVRARSPWAIFIFVEEALIGQRSTFSICKSMFGIANFAPMEEMGTGPGSLPNFVLSLIGQTTFRSIDRVVFRAIGRILAFNLQ
jgi:hypothetical protein